MTRMKKTLLAVAILTVLGIVGSATQKTQPALTTPTTLSIPVNVTGPLPLPVSGTVSAQQSGTWNVGINGTPSVNIANSPAVTFANSANAPFFFRNVDDPGRIPYQSTVTGPDNCTTSGGCFWSFAAVPANHRLVVQHISGILTLTQEPQGANAVIEVRSGNFSTYVPLSAIPAGNVNVAFDESMQTYIDAGLYLAVYPIGAFGTPSPNATITATGYVLDCSAGPCAAIAQ